MLVVVRPTSTWRILLVASSGEQVLNVVRRVVHLRRKETLKVSHKLCMSVVEVLRSRFTFSSKVGGDTGRFAVCRDCVEYDESRRLKIYAASYSMLDLRRHGFV
jgi:hypothetical protein